VAANPPGEHDRGAVGGQHVVKPPVEAPTSRQTLALDVDRIVLQCAPPACEPPRRHRDAPAAPAHVVVGMVFEGFSTSLSFAMTMPASIAARPAPALEQAAFYDHRRRRAYVKAGRHAAFQPFAARAASRSTPAPLRG